MKFLKVRFISTPFISLVFLCLCACRTVQVKEVIVGPDFIPKNFFSKYPELPSDIRKVAILPITANEQNSFSIHGRVVLEPALVTELGKAGRFETTVVTRDQLRQWTGKEHWRAQDELPASFLSTVKEHTASDAVLFVHLVQYSPYPPLTIGWQMKLVSIKNTEILWALDEVFDSSEQTVSNSARRYAKNHLKSNPVLEDTQSILIQPTRFGQYTVHVAFNTLPPR